MRTDVREHQSWTREEVTRLELMLKRGMDAVDIAVRLHRSVHSVRVEIATFEQAGRMRAEAQRSGQVDTADTGRVLHYRLLQPLTEDEAFALGLCLPNAERQAVAFGCLEAFRSGFEKIEQAIAAR